MVQRGYSPKYPAKSSYTPRSLRRIEKKTKRNLLITIVIGIVLLYFLLTWGLPNLIGSLSFLNKFKNSPEQPKSDVVNDAIAPPNLNIPFEATNSAKIKISGNSTPNAKVEIYFDDELKTIASAHSDGSFETDDIDLSVGTNNIYGKTVDENGNKSLASKTIQLNYDNSLPKLQIDSPEDNKTIQGGDKKVTVTGKADGATTVTINDVAVILGNDGSFSKDVSLNEGQNTITIVATNDVGSSTKVEKIVTYNP